ncbi:MAG TPA: VIT domain-containing protein [Bryobacteraceae bacterium]|nr:VIT domain-containing protein [Bryobacteraceae bacterium]
MLPRFLSLCTLFALPALTQVVIINGRWPVPMPLPRPIPIRADCTIKSVEVDADIRDQAAHVRVSQVFQNPSPMPMEAQFLFPLPEGAAISGLTLIAGGQEMTGRLLSKEEARRIYEDIVRRRRDPALLEYMGHDLFQTSVFPVPPGGESTVQISYSQLLKKDSGLVDFLLPLGTVKHSAKPVQNVSVTVNIASTAPLRTVYSPSHQVDISQPDSTHALCKLSLHDVANPDDMRLLYSSDASPVGLNVISYKAEDSEDGYFALLATPDARGSAAQKIAKTVLFVCDRSGSMSGKKIEQVKSALQFLLRQLQPGDTFNIVAYDSEVESFRPELQRADGTSIQAALAWVDGISAGGGTNIDGALRTGLRMLTDSSRPNYVFFLTDGQPTVGERGEVNIASNAARENKVNARMFVFGVGFDVNGRLLDRLARELRGQSVYVRPNENVEAPISSLYAKVGYPMLTNVALDIQLDGGTTSHVYPRQMPDLFHGDQLVLVGRYRKGGAAKIVLTGSANGKKETFTYTATFADKYSDDTNGFVARLWAIRRIGDIIDEMDLHGRNQELVDELVALSTKHGILTPYTSFLADDNVRLTSRRANVSVAAESAEVQLNTVGGAAGFNLREQKSKFQQATNMDAYDAPAGSTRAVKQIGQKAFFKKDQVWQDSTVTAEQAKNAIHIVQFSRKYFDLAASHGGAMAQYLAFDEPVLVTLGNQTYQIDPEPKP